MNGKRVSLAEVFIAPGDVLEHSDEMLYFHGEMQGILHFDWLIGKRNFLQQNKLELVEIVRYRSENLLQQQNVYLKCFATLECYITPEIELWKSEICKKER